MGFGWGVGGYREGLVKFNIGRVAGMEFIE